MRFVIIGDSETNYSGEFSAIFDDGDVRHTLSFNLDDWLNMGENGRFGKDFVEVYRPETHMFEFNKFYELELDEARKVYSALYVNGWK